MGRRLTPTLTLDRTLAVSVSLTLTLHLILTSTLTRHMGRCGLLGTNEPRQPLRAPAPTLPALRRQSRARLQLRHASVRIQARAVLPTARAALLRVAAGPLVITP
eukprot:scaffold37496_cov63-Phaeocystis_antarctica.AAC.1